MSTKEECITKEEKRRNQATQSYRQVLIRNMNEAAGTKQKQQSNRIGKQNINGIDIYHIQSRHHDRD
jgi:hypothetical protein